MAFHNEKEQLYLETDASGVGHSASFMKARDGMYFQETKHWTMKCYGQ